MSYAGDHASAYADVAAAGVALVVSRTSVGAESVSGGFGAARVSPLRMVAFAKASDPVRLRELSLTLERSVTLFAVPERFPMRAYTDDFVKPNDTLVWNGVTMTVRAVGPLVALDGFVLASTLVASV